VSFSGRYHGGALWVLVFLYVNALGRDAYSPIASGRSPRAASKNLTQCLISQGIDRRRFFAPFNPETSVETIVNHPGPKDPGFNE
jgi:hypothetical protein